MRVKTNQDQARTEEGRRFSAPPRLDLTLLVSALPEDYQVSEAMPGEYLVEGPIDPQVLATVTAWCAQINVLATDLRVEQRSLEDVFLELTGRELRELRRLKRESPTSSRFVFISERGAPLSSEGFNRMVKRAAAAAKLGIKVHAHMLRHACGFKLANDGIDTRSLQAYLGHSNIQNTTRYTALASGRFKNFWRD